MPPVLGAIPGERGTTFRLWSTTHRTCEVRLFDARGGVLRTEPMMAIGDGVYEASLPDVSHGALYRFVLDGTEVNDPYARCLPAGIEGPSMVYRLEHRWQHDHVVRPLREHAIYELHVGTFTEEGTYAAAARRLPLLVELGVTAIELLPLGTFSGRVGWGYDGVAHYAPHFAYGTPDELAAFVDAAHGAGLSVFLDVVYNHFGPKGNVLPQYSPEYFTNEIENVWGQAPDFRVPWMRSYVLDNIAMWLREYRFDGLRFDAVHAIVDPSEKDIVRECTDTARAILPGVVLMAEDDRNDPALVEKLGFDAVWADDFHHAVHVTITGERDGYYACYEPGAASIARAIERGWLYEGQPYPTSGKPRGKPAPQLPAEAFVYCLQNHDQIGNRAFGDRLSAVASPDAYAAATTLFLFLPMTPLLYQGEEWAASTPFCYFTDHDAELGAIVSKGRREEFKKFRAFADPHVRETIPDPQAPSTVAQSTLRWEERDREPHAGVLALHRALLALRRSDPALAHAGRDAMTVEVTDGVLVVRRSYEGATRALVANFSDRPARAPIEGAVLVASRPVTLPELPAWSAVIVDASR